MDEDNKVVDPQPEGGVSPEVEPLSTATEVVPPEVMAQIEVEADLEANIPYVEEEGPDLIQEELDAV